MVRSRITSRAVANASRLEVAFSLWAPFVESERAVVDSKSLATGCFLRIPNPFTSRYEAEIQKEGRRAKTQTVCEGWL
jgi:hypothetical protein